jgi:hypothetical protein
MWKILVVVILLAVGAAAVWVTAGRAAGPAIEITGPDAIGQTGEIDVTVTAPHSALNRLDVALSQNGASFPVFSLATDSAQLTHEGADRVRITRPTGKRLIPDLKPGDAEITVTAVRPVLFGLREVQSTAKRSVDVRLNPPQISVVSRQHFINHGGSEAVIYRVAPPESASGVQVGDERYPGFPATGAGIDSGDPGLRIAFFAVLWNQDVDTPISLYATDSLGNEGTGSFEYKVFPKEFKSSQIHLDDHFLTRVVPPILQNSPDLKVDDPTDMLASYLAINRKLRRMNDAEIAELAKHTAPQILWHGPFKQLINTAVEAGFADQRTYLYKGKDVDHEVHLGFDLASIAEAPVHAANRGRVVHAGWLGIYGNCVILDHGMGLQSLYAHLSSISVKVGDMVEAEGLLGRTGSTGLAGGDHLHFTMLLGGHAVTPIDWWSSQWVEDRVLRKIMEAGGTPP